MNKEHKARELDMITPKNHALRSYVTWLPVTLLYNLQLDDVPGLISKNLLCAFGQSEKK